MIGELLLATAVAAAPAPRPVVTFDRLNVVAGHRVTVHVDKIATRGRVRVYLVPTAAATKVRRALDPRLHYVGAFTPRGRHGMVTFSVPPLAAGRYTAWCSGCGRPTSYLQLRLPAACSPTLPGGGRPPGLSGHGPYVGNGALWSFAHGTLALENLSTKLFWWAAGVAGELAVQGRRLDGAGRLAVHAVNRGQQAGFRGSGTWATPVTFPSEGCWRITGRVRDVALSYVVEVRAR